MSREVTLRLLWRFQAQFAGYLVAEHEGLAKRRGIDLRCQPIDFAEGGMKALLRGACDMAIASPAHLVESEAPGRLAFALAVQQASPLVYPVRKRAGIATPKDLEGRTAAIWPSGEDLELRWMLLKAGADPEKVKRLPTGDTVGAFVEGRADCAQMTTYHEIHEMEAHGLPLDAVTLFRPADWDAALLKDGLIIRRDWIGTDDTLLQDLVEICLEGWQIAFTDPERAVAVCARARPDMSVEDHARQLEHMKDLATCGPALKEGFAVPHRDHVRRAIDAVTAVEGHGAELDPDEIAVRRYWQAAPADLKAMPWA